MVLPATAFHFERSVVARFAAGELPRSAYRCSFFQMVAPRSCETKNSSASDIPQYRGPDNPEEIHVAVGVFKEAKQVVQVADLLPAIETRAAVHIVGDACPCE